MNKKTVLVTGGAGFIGSNFIHYMFKKYPGVKVVNLDLLTYAGNPENLKDLVDNPDYNFVKGDIADSKIVNQITGGVEYIINFAAESHVDRSIEDPSVFIRTNVMGTQVLLEAARKNGVERYLQISTDEVYGSLGPTGYFTETTPLAPNSPYSASKAGADLLAKAYHETYGLPVLITRCSNNYGPYQFPEKLIPFFIKRLLNNQTVPVYGDGLNVRDWLHVADHCSAIDLVLQKGRVGEVYNIGGNNEKTNIEITKLVLTGLGKPESMIEYVKDRLGHDRRYAIDSSKIQEELGWTPTISFEEGIKQTIAWYLDNREWWKNL
ncbi:MAG: dTDP-glucose 4,6-dehydratase [Firmicutes bacterium]|nr:dTDP-glucose 4,6-dehydratase [Bacillota bacterium]